MSRILRRLPWWLAAAALAIGCLIWIYPFLWMVSASLKTSAEVFTKGLDLLPGGDPAWDNYERAWVSADFGKYLLNTVIVTVCTVVVVVVRCAMAGYAIARHDFRGRRIVMGVLIATLFVPAGYTIIPLVDLAQRLGMLNSLTGMVLAMSGAAHVAAILLYVGYFRRHTQGTDRKRAPRRRRVRDRLLPHHAAAGQACDGHGHRADLPVHLERVLPAAGLHLLPAGPAHRQRRHARLRRREHHRLVGHGRRGDDLAAAGRRAVRRPAALLRRGHRRCRQVLKFADIS